MHRFGFRVRYGDTDQMGFAYYANYLRWFEVGRAEMIRALGSSYRAVEEDGIRLPVLEARCRYLKPARYDDLLVVETGILTRSRAAVRFGYRVRLEADDTLLAWGHTEHCYLDPAGRPVRPSALLTALLDRAPWVPEGDPR
jgi:acyl-CoA thioester hydrolase